MTTKGKAVGALRMLPTADNKKLDTYFCTSRQVLKALIVRAAVRGLISYWIADFLIQRGGLRDA